MPELQRCTEPVDSRRMPWNGKCSGKVLPTAEGADGFQTAATSGEGKRLADETAGSTTRIRGAKKTETRKKKKSRGARSVGQSLSRSWRGASRLTSLERREFFSMASEITDEAIVRDDLSHQEVFAQVWATLGTLCTPAFLMDSFGDLVGANRAVLDFHKLNWSQFNAARCSAGNVNILSLLLAPDAPIRRVLGSGWHAIALANMRQWRVMTLRYRHTNRFRNLFTTLSAYPDFQMLWAASRRRVEDDNSRLRSHFYTHGVYGPVAYTVFTNISLSANGDLYLATFVPQNRDTGAVFQNWRIRATVPRIDALAESQSSLQRICVDAFPGRKQGKVLLADLTVIIGSF